MKVEKVLEFLVPIMYLEESTWMTIIVGNTIFGALIGERKVDWALVMRDIVLKLVSKVGKSKPTSIYFYILQLYHCLNIIMRDKKI